MNTTYTFESLQKYLLLLPLFILLVYYVPILFLEFGYSDDYHALIFQRSSEDWAATANMNGRPIQGWIVEFLFGTAYDIKGLSIARWIGLLFLGGTCYLLYLDFKNLFNNNKILAAFVALFPATLPSFEIITLWPSAFPALFSLFFSLLAGKCFINTNATLTYRYLLYGLGILFLTIGLMTYQAGAAACFIPWLIRSTQHDNLKQLFTSIWPPVSSFILANLGYFVWFLQQKAGLETTSSRTEFTLDYADKIVWFVESPLKLSIASFATLESDGIRKAFIILQVTFILVGIVMYVLKSSKKVAFVIIGIWIVAFPIAYYTGIIAVEKWPSYRTQSVLSLVVVFLLAMSINQFKGQKIKYILTGCITGLFVFFGAKHIYKDYALLQVHDLLELEQDLMNLNANTLQLDPPIEVHIIRPSRLIGWDKGFIKQFGVDETGIPSSSIEWSLPSMTELLLEKNEIKKERFTFIIHDKSDSIAYKNKPFLIDLEKNFEEY